LYDAALSSADAIWSGSQTTEGLEAIAHRRQRFALPRSGWKVTVRRHNIVEEEIPAASPFIAACNIDVDLYEAVPAALQSSVAHGAPRIIAVEDPGHTPQ
jgi:hypothetical protein